MEHRAIERISIRGVEVHRACRSLLGFLRVEGYPLAGLSEEPVISLS